MKIVGLRAVHGESETLAQSLIYGWLSGMHTHLKTVAQGPPVPLLRHGC